MPCISASSSNRARRNRSSIHATNNPWRCDMLRPSNSFQMLPLFFLVFTLYAASANATVVGGPYSGTTAGGSVSSFNWQQTINNDSNRLLVVLVGSPMGSVSGVTFNGTALTWKANAANDGVVTGVNSTGVLVSVWYLVSPPVGTYTIAVTLSGSTSSPCGIGAEYQNVNQTTPLGTAYSDPGQAGPPATSIDVYVDNTVSGGMAIDAVGAEANSTPTWNVGSGQTQRGTENAGSGIVMSLSEKTSNGSTTILSGSTYTQSAICQLGVEVRPY